MPCLKSLILLLALLMKLNAFNHPEIKWKTVSTNHFTINFYDKTEYAVYAAWKSAEDAYNSLSTIYSYQPVEKIAISLAEYDDFSNGLADWTSGNIIVWLSDNRFDLRSNSTWLCNVITHELAHIMSLEQKRHRQVLNLSVQATISSPNEFFSISEPFMRLSEYPSWLAEGIAQYETEQLNHDCFDSRREMILRTAILSNTALTLDEMGNFNHTVIGNELVYNQGFAFTKYIAGRFGSNQLHDILKKATFQKTDIFDAFYKATGFSLNNCYLNWIDSLKAVYTAQFPQKNNDIHIISSDGNFNMLPKISPDNQYLSWLSSGKDEGGRTDLIIATPGEYKIVGRIKYAHTAFCFSNTSDHIYYVKSRIPDKNGSFFNDLFVRDLPNGREKRITRNGRIFDVCAIPGSKNLLCICYIDNAFSLFECDISTGILMKLLSGEPGMPLVQTSVNPANASQYVITKIISGKSRLFLMTRPSDTLIPFSPGIGQEESPLWAKNGRIYYSADYNGIFNIYSVLPDGNDLQTHTETSGGYFSPLYVSEDKIIASHYQPSGFAIVHVKSKSAPYQPSPNYLHCSYTKLPAPEGTVAITAKPYTATFRRSTWEHLILGQINKNNSLIFNKIQPFDTNKIIFGGGFGCYKSDALQKRNQLISLLLYGIRTIPKEDNNTRFSAKQNRKSSKNIVVKNPLRGYHEYSLCKEYKISDCSLNPKQQFLKNMRWDGTPKNVITPHIISRDLLLQNGYPVPFYNNIFSKSSRSLSESNDSTSTDRIPPFYFISQPLFAIENNTFKPTFGIQITANLVYTIIPQLIQFTPYLKLQLSRDWECDAFPEFKTIPFNGINQFRIPLYLTWSHAGYYNHDFQYNNSDYSQIEIGVSPEIIPGYKTDSDADTIIVATKGISVQLSLFHGIQLFKYSSLLLSSLTLARFFSTPILDKSPFEDNPLPSDILDGKSDCYLFSSQSAKLIFPVIKNINTGGRQYFDALYGYLQYKLVGYANKSFITHRTQFKKDLFTNADYLNESLFLDHLISFGFKLGIYKSYLILKNMNFDFSIQLLRQDCRITLTSGL